MVLGLKNWIQLHIEMHVLHKKEFLFDGNKGEPLNILLEKIKNIKLRSFKKDIHTGQNL